MLKKATGAIYLTLAMFLAGSSVVVGKIVIGDIPVFLSQVITLFIALVFIFPIAWIKEGWVFDMHFKKKDIGFMALQALTGMFLFRVFLLNGLKLTSALDSGIITSLGPAVLVVLAFFMLKEKPMIKSWMGILLCVGGVAAINLAGTSGTEVRAGLRYAGNALVFLAVIGEALFTVFRKKISYQNRAITSTMIIIAFAMLMFTPVAVMESRTFDFSLLTMKTVIPMVIYGVFCTVLAYICWFEGVARTSTSMAAGFTGVMPVSSVLLSGLVLGEKITLTHIIGTLLVVGGIYIIASKPKQSAVPKPACGK